MKYTILAMLFAAAALTSCIDDNLNSDVSIDDLEIPKGITDGYSLNLVVTLDKMGGGNTTRGLTRANYGYNPMEEIENYINPEKFRVLFFNDKEEFLYESKSRWVKRLDPTADHSEWFVSIPVFSYGNDEDEHWDWEAIRTALTSNSFKVAIMVNRPEWECFPDLDKVNSGNRKFDNSGPHWKASDTSWGVPEGHKAKTIFDLHHCQPDPIYESKGKSGDWQAAAGEYYYQFVMGKDKDDPTKPTMSATSCWVDHGPNLEDDGVKIGDRRLWIRPSQSYPIPMYGIQEFNKIENWVPGTPFNLSKLPIKGDDSNYEFKSISLLRSVVKLELRIPKKLVNTPPQYVAIKYTNIYARCEPMDVWTPTNEIWEGETGHEDNCEIERIQKYGQITKNGDQGSGNAANGAPEAESFNTFRKRISWFYGAWLEKGWDFGTFTKDNVVKNDLSYPRVFNPCTQRNLLVRCDNVDYTNDFNDEYYHWIVYTGERNLNDPAYLHKMGQSDSYGATVAFWMIEIDGQVYRIPITDYKDYEKNPVYNINSSTYDENKEPDNGDMQQYSVDIYNADTPDYLPWPLVRNHVYRITLTAASLYTHEWDFTKFSDETIKCMKADETNWNGPRYTKPKEKDEREDGDEYDHWYNLTWNTNDKQMLKANGQIIKETEDLYFKSTSSTDMVNFERLYGTKANGVWSDWYLRLNKNLTVTFPKMKSGQILTIEVKYPITAGSGNPRIIELTESSMKSLEFIQAGSSEVTVTDGRKYEIAGEGKSGNNPLYTLRWKVKDDVTNSINVEFSLPENGLAFTRFAIEEGSAKSASSTRAAGNGMGFKVKSEDLYSKSIKFD